MGFLRQVTGKTAKRQRERFRRNAASASVIKKAVTKTLETYIDNRKTTVAEWVTLRPILHICNRDMGYEGRGRRRELSRQQTVALKQVNVALENISKAARERRWKSASVAREGDAGRW